VSTRTRRPKKARRPPEESSAEQERYRRAAEAALEQLDAGIEYLRRLQKRQLAARLARNRAMIVRRWMR
jgi:hypothetical protein